MDKSKDEKEKASDCCPEFIDMEHEEETKDPENCYRFGIGEEDGKMKTEWPKEERVKKLTEKKGLDDACESWIKKVEAFRRTNDFKETKGPTEKEYTEIEETSYASDCYQKEIEVEKYKNKCDSRKLRKEKNVPKRVSPFGIVPGQVVKGAVKIEKREALTICLVQFRIRKGSYEENKKIEIRKLEENRNNMYWHVT
ncbi:hypothetical protein C2G38_2146503 [Gigaspora rosea]|uniref:Uncharacterized protein n=1 Tax=Gigaspora rosea TaxID=44941 RepID=A0A397UHG0_9GLOM|nr:hypothetical protein C2G38_2146503 [Gigaspora rosea]